MIQTKGFIVTCYGDVNAGISDQSWSIKPRTEGDLMQFATQEDFDKFKKDIAGAFELCSDTPILVESIEEVEFDIKEAEFNGADQPQPTR